MTMEEEKRNIDMITTSMTVVELNNLIVSMRNLMKRARIQVIHKLTSQIKKLRNKKGTEKQISTNKKKTERIVKELEIIKELNIDKVLKFSLFNMETLDKVSQDSITQRCMVRMSCHRLIQNRVKKWREEHPDWRSLAAFIQQHSSRRLKKLKRHKDNNKKQKYEDDSSNDLTSDEECSDTLIEEKQSPLKPGSVQLKATTKEKTLGDSSNNKNSQKKSSSLDKHITVNVNKLVDPRVQLETNKKLDKGTQSETDSNVNSDNGGTSDKSELSNDTDNDTDADDFSGQHNEQSSTDSQIYNEKKLIDTEIEKVSLTKQSRSFSRGEVVVKRLNLKNFGKDQLSEGEKDLSFLFQETTATASATKEESDGDDEDKVIKCKDPFFAGDSSSNEEHHSADEQSVDNYVSSDEETNISKLKKAKKRMMAESTFIGSLSARPMKHKRFLSKHDGHRSKMSKGTSFKPHGKTNLSKPHVKQYITKGKDAGFKGEKFIPGHKGVQNSDYNKMKGQGKINETSSKSGTETLHPSWEASKKRKQQLSAIKPFEGKKVTFDD